MLPHFNDMFHFPTLTVSQPPPLPAEKLFVSPQLQCTRSTPVYSVHTSVKKCIRYHMIQCLVGWVEHRHFNRSHTLDRALIGWLCFLFLFWGSEGYHSGNRKGIHIMDSIIQNMQYKNRPIQTRQLRCPVICNQCWWRRSSWQSWYI